MDQAKPSGWGLYKRILHYVKAYWFALLLAVVGNILFAIVDAGFTYYIKPLTNKGLIAKDPAFLAAVPIVIIVLFLVRGVGGFMSTYFMGWAAKGLIRDLREMMYNKFILLPAQYFDQTSSGKLLAKLTYNIDQISIASGSTLITMVRQGCTLIGLIAVMFLNSWRLSLLIFCVAPIMVVLIRYVSLRFRKLSKRIQTSIGDITHIAEESVVGYREIRLFNAQRQQQESFWKFLNYNYRQEMKMIFTDALSQPIIVFICAIVFAVAVYFAIGRGHLMLSAGAFVSLVVAMLASFRPVKALSQVNSNIQKGLAGAEIVFDTLDEPIEIDTGTKTIKNVKGDVKFEQVSFSYSGDKSPVLSKVSLHVPMGKTVALVGPSGGGKSTLVSLLSRFYTPTAGKILLDDVDISTLTLDSLRQQLSLVSQHVTLFDDTIYNNIAFGLKSGASEAAVIDAAKAANAWEFIKDSPQGLNTMIGQNGLNLSGGQRQRVAIARALLKNAPVLILDEATAALDNTTEKSIQEALERLQKGRTTLIIAHRLSTIQNADLIVVLDKGKIVETGSHNSLMKAGGLYAALQQSATFD